MVEDDDDEDDVAEASPRKQTEENNYMGTFRDELINIIWNNRQIY